MGSLMFGMPFAQRNVGRSLGQEYYLTKEEFQLFKTIANTVRGLSADAVEKANSGHPGMPLGAADIGTVLFAEVMNYDPTTPAWPNRDRFVLSAGHGSMLLYSFLHLAGYDVSMEDLKQFRQLNSITPGHPEYGMTPGVETTTGPLGQGIANAVGMALAEAMLAAKFNRPGYPIVDHYVYVICGDGDLMEGVSAEASSLAGHLGLGKLIVIYDSNRISIEGSTDIAFGENVALRYESYGWHVVEADGHDFDAIRRAIEEAKAETNRPSLIVAKTHIGFGSPKQDDASVHGAPLGEEAVAELKKNLGLPDETFYVPEEVYEFFRELKERQIEKRKAWEAMFEKWSQEYPDLRREWDAAHNLSLPEDLEEQLPQFEVGSQVATRDASGKVLQKLADLLPYLVGGSADLAPSTKTYMEGKGSVTADDFTGRNLHFGVREHAMGAILNGMSLYGGFRVFGSTFLVFSDYMRPTVRLSALMNQPVIYVFTHDSIWVGEDGPTHQPIEHTESLRIIPGVEVFRPADAEETKAAWAAILRRTDGPGVLVLTRQKLPVFAKDGCVFENVAKGGYVVKGKEITPDVVLIASGSEVSLALEAAEMLTNEGIKVRVVSVPCRERFMAQDASYRAEVLGEAPRLIIEAGVGSGWNVLTRPGDRIMSIERFGASGPAAEVAEALGMTPKVAVEMAKSLL